MTVSNQTNSVSYSGNGSTTVFAYTFKIFANSDLIVTLRNNTTGVLTTQVLTTDYTVSGAGSDSGGNVTFGTAPASGTTVLIRRSLPYTQETDYVENDPFPAAAHEDALDKLTMLAQQNKEEDAIRFPEGDVAIGLNNVLPSAVNRASKLMAFDSSGNVAVYDSTTGPATDAANVSYIPAGSGAQTTTVQAKLRESVSVKDFGAVGDGVTDDTAAITNALAALPDGGVLIGKAGDTYLITSRLQIGVSTAGRHGLTIDFNGATLKDNVSGTAAEFGNRPDMLFFIRESTNITIRNFKYEGVRAPATDFAIVQIGANAGSDVWSASNDNANVNITIENIIATNIPAKACFIQVQGNSSNVTIQNISLYGDCRVGVNCEYSLAPYDDYESISAQLAGIEDRYGVHAFNITVRNFSGYDNSVCVGFLRTAGVYNVIYENCYGYNVDNFIYNYSGDRSIYRIGQNVIYNNCSAYTSESATVLNGPVVTIVATEDDGSTGAALPAFTKYDFKTTFNNCEFQSNKLQFGVRYIGDDGSTVFNSCVFRDTSIGLRMGGSTGVWVDYPQTALTLNDCIFIDNDVDADIRTAPGTAFNNCQFRNATGSNPALQFTDCDNTIFTNCQFSGIQADQYYVDIDASSTGTVFNNCRFSDQATFAAIRTVNAITGFDNVNADTALTHVASGYKQMLTQESQTFTPTLVGSTGGSIAGTGTYSRIGDVVFFNGYIQYANDSSIQGTVTITGMPFDAQGITQAITFEGSRMLLTSGYKFFATLSGTTVNIYETFNSGTIHSAITQASLSTSTTVRIWISGSYIAD